MSSDLQNPRWNRNWTFIMATAGAAVGLGNIWKFPYIAGENGGGAFVLMYLICILLFGIPIMIAEVMLGKKGRENPVHAMLKHSRTVGSGKAWSIIGIMGVLAGIMIIMYYSVVAGWALDYVFQSATGSYMNKPADEVAAGFSVLYDDKARQLMWHSVFIVVTGLIVALGVTRGIGNAVDVLMPILFILLFSLLIYAYNNGNFQQGLEFLFNPDFSKLTPKSALVAMGHAFFTLSLGMGTVMVYGSYMPESSSVPRAVLTVAFLDTLIALIAGMTIFPIVFASGLTPGSGPGLLFETLPTAFSNMQYGVLVGTAFFVLVAIAALSSMISLIEPAVAWLVKLGNKRVVATLSLVTLCWAGGAASAYSGQVFDTLDFVTSNVMLPLGGLLIAVFVGWCYGYTRTRKENSGMNTLTFNCLFITIRFIAPIGVAIVFFNGIQEKLLALFS